MCPAGKLVDELESQPVHVCHGEHGYNLFSGEFPEYSEGEREVGPKTAIGEHYSFRETGGSRRVINNSKFIRIVIRVAYVFRAEAIGIFLPE